MVSRQIRERSEWVGKKIVAVPTDVANHITEDKFSANKDTEDNFVDFLNEACLSGVVESCIESETSSDPTSVFVKWSTKKQGSKEWIDLANFSWLFVETSLVFATHPQMPSFSQPAVELKIAKGNGKVFGDKLLCQFFMDNLISIQAEEAVEKVTEESQIEEWTACNLEKIENKKKRTEIDEKIKGWLETDRTQRILLRSDCDLTTASVRICMPESSKYHIYYIIKGRIKQDGRNMLVGETAVNEKVEADPSVTMVTFENPQIIIPLMNGKSPSQISERGGRTRRKTDHFHNYKDTTELPDKKVRKSRSSKNSPKNPQQATSKKRGKNHQDSGVKIGEAPRVKRKYTRRNFGGKSRKQSAEVENRNEPISEEKKVEEKITESGDHKKIVADEKEPKKRGIEAFKTERRFPKKSPKQEPAAVSIKPPTGHLQNPQAQGCRRNHKNSPPTHHQAGNHRDDRGNLGSRQNETENPRFEADRSGDCDVTESGASESQLFSRRSHDVTVENSPSASRIDKSRPKSLVSIGNQAQGASNPWQRHNCYVSAERAYRFCDVSKKKLQFSQPLLLRAPPSEKPLAHFGEFPQKVPGSEV